MSPRRAQRHGTSTSTSTSVVCPPAHVPARAEKHMGGHDGAACHVALFIGCGPRAKLVAAVTGNELVGGVLHFHFQLFQLPVYAIATARPI